MSENAPPTNGSRSLARGELFELLSNGRRRYVLEYLSRAETPVSFGTLTDEVAAWENDTSVEALDEAERKRIYVSLHQCHLPRLEDAGVVQFDREAGTIELVGRAGDLGRYLGDDRTGPARAWSLTYCTASLAGLVTTGVATLDVGPLTVVSDLTVATLSIGVLAVIATAHWFSIRREPSTDALRLTAERR